MILAVGSRAAAWADPLAAFACLALIVGGWAVLPGWWAYGPGGLMAILTSWLPDPRQPGRFEAAWRARLARRPELDLGRMRGAVRVEIAFHLGVGAVLLGVVGWAVATNGGSVMTVFLFALGCDAFGKAIRTGFGAWSIGRDSVVRSLGSP